MVRYNRVPPEGEGAGSTTAQPPATPGEGAGSTAALPPASIPWRSSFVFDPPADVPVLPYERVSGLVMIHLSEKYVSLLEVAAASAAITLPSSDDMKDLVPALKTDTSAMSAVN